MLALRDHVPRRPGRVSTRPRAAAADQHHAPGPVSPPRHRDPPPRSADQQGAHGRLPRLRAGRVELRARGPRRPAGAPPGSDPADFRRRNLLRPDELPFKTSAARCTTAATTRAASSWRSRISDETFARGRRSGGEGRHVGVGMSSTWKSPAILLRVPRQDWRAFGAYESVTLRMNRRARDHLHRVSPIGQRRRRPSPDRRLAARARSRGGSRFTAATRRGRRTASAASRAAR